jgi:hypothetical protein
MHTPRAADLFIRAGLTIGGDDNRSPAKSLPLKTKATVSIAGDGRIRPNPPRKSAPVDGDRLQLRDAPAFQELSERNRCNQTNYWKKRQGRREKSRYRAPLRRGGDDGVEGGTRAGGEREE